MLNLQPYSHVPDKMGQREGYQGRPDLSEKHSPRSLLSTSHGPELCPIAQQEGGLQSQCFSFLVDDHGQSRQCSKDKRKLICALGSILECLLQLGRLIAKWLLTTTEIGMSQTK